MLMAIKDYDVFLSFSGQTREGFTGKLFKELERKGFQAFMDCENIYLGDEIHPTIKKAIKYSKSAIVILSDKFASSKHCLNELVLILERNRTSRYFIIPIFYYVETDDVKHQLGNFGAAFEQIKKERKNDEVNEWITALASIGGIKGKEIKEHNGLMEESTIIEEFVETFKQKFYAHYPESVQDSQDMPPTTSTTLNIEPAAATSRLEDTGSSWLNKFKEWKTECKNYVVEVFIVMCVLIAVVTVLANIPRYGRKAT